tara:strand:- start:574 stop:1347 length:774 start_codon:yes stop_codon:yes gene_type:complete
MKIACCLYGHIGGKTGRDGIGGWLDPKVSIENYKENIFLGKEVDYFIHSWSKSHEQIICDLLKPKDFVFQNQKSFSHITLGMYDLSRINDYIGIITSNDDPAIYLLELAKRAHSRWFSTSKSIQLCLKYSRDNKIIYDVIFVLRFDLYFYRKILLTHLKNNTLYTSRRAKENLIAIEDLILFGSPDVISSLCHIYNNILDFSIRPPVALKQLADKNDFHVNDNLTRGLDFDLLRESSVNPSIGFFRKVRKNLRRLIT